MATNHRRGRYVYRKKQQNKMAMMLITVVIMILLAVVGIKSIEMNSRVQELSETEAELNDEIKQ